jgi:hypothetical protein
MSFVVSPSLTFRTEVQRVQMPAMNAKGRVSLRANRIGGREPSGSTSFSEKLVNGTRQRPDRRMVVQCGPTTKPQKNPDRPLEEHVNPQPSGDDIANVAAHGSSRSVRRHLCRQTNQKPPFTFE